MLSPFVVHSLGNVSYGIWVLLGSLVGYLGLLDLGVRGAVTRYIAKFHAQSNHLDATRVASSALAIFTAAGLLAILVSITLALVVPQLFEVPEQLVTAARIVVILGGINVAVSIVSGVYGGIVAGLQRFDYFNAVEVVVAGIRAGAVILALNAGFGLVALAAIQLAMSSVRGLANYRLSRRLYPELRARVSECRRTDLATIFSFSVSALLLTASGMLIMYTDSVVIGAFLPLEMITFFAIAANLTEYARGPISGISQTITPWVSSLEGGGKLDELQRVLLAAARISTLVVLPIVLTFIVRGRTFIGLWMGQDYAKPAGDVLQILSLGLWFVVGYQVVVATMMGISKHRGLVPAFVVEAVCNIGLSVVWIRSYGIVGVAWATTVPRMAGSLLFMPWYLRRVLGIPIRKLWLTVWVYPSLAMVPFVIGSYAIERWWPASNLVLYFGQVVLALPLAGIGAWAMSLTPAEKHRLVGLGSRLVCGARS